MGGGGGSGDMRGHQVGCGQTFHFEEFQNAAST